MTDRDRLDILARVPELSSTGATLRELLAFFDEVVVPAGVRLAQEGRLCHELVIVAAGELEVCRQGRASRLEAGDSFGWQAMQERGRHDASVLTVSPSRLLVMGHAQFRAAEGLAFRSTGRAAGPNQEMVPSRALPPPPGRPSPTDAPQARLAAKKSGANPAC